MRVEVRLNEKDFFRFSLFDAFSRRRAWLRPAVFAAILGACAALCFALHQRRGAVLLGSVLLIVALGLPAAWFLSFFLSLRRQAREQGLAGGKYVYTLDLHDGEEGISVDNGREHAVFPWAQMFHAYRHPDAAYLYVTPQRAFLIPDHCVQGAAGALWALIERRLPQQRRTSHKR